jgi:rhamnose utilization protein RhaD (predicted bifunctional aldolase and dehydrogenase)
MSTVPADKLASLLKLSHDLGREDRGLAMLGEGNTSCRIDADTFLVKASGSSLSNLPLLGAVAAAEGGPDDRCRGGAGVAGFAR